MSVEKKREDYYLFGRLVYDFNKSLYDLVVQIPGVGRPYVAAVDFRCKKLLGNYINDAGCQAVSDTLKEYDAKAIAAPLPTPASSGNEAANQR